jgi:hypothetical protein
VVWRRGIKADLCISGDTLIGPLVGVSIQMMQIKIELEIYCSGCIPKNMNV